MLGICEGSSTGVPTTMYELLVARWNFSQASVFCHILHVFYVICSILHHVIHLTFVVVRLQVELSTRWKNCKKVFGECKKLEDRAIGYVARFPYIFDTRIIVWPYFLILFCKNYCLALLELRCKTSEMGMRKKLKVGGVQSSLSNHLKGRSGLPVCQWGLESVSDALFGPTPDSSHFAPTGRGSQHVDWP